MVDVADVIKINPEKSKRFRTLQRELGKIQNMLAGDISEEQRRRLLDEEQALVSLLQKSKRFFA